MIETENLTRKSGDLVTVASLILFNLPSATFRREKTLTKVEVSLSNMPVTKQQRIRPVRLLCEVRKSVSDILDKPFTEKIDHQIFKPDKKALAIWAADCAERVLPYFEELYPDDDRPRKAIETLREWISTGMFHMKAIRGASLAAHAAAKGKTDFDAVFAAHAAGQAVGTAHVPTHALGSSLYAIRAAAAHTGDIDDGLTREHDWQLKRLRQIVGKA